MTGKVFSSARNAIVLIVEDEPLLRLVAVDFVEEAGFQVIEAGSADEAVTILESRADIRIVFTDIDMPGSLDGMKLAACIRDRWPPIEIIMTSGHRKPVLTELPARVLFFPKPYDPRSIVAAIQAFAA
ncbi:response regulator [Sphingomonas bacterium]|uniref:response regulator n=1 Tax=Sphingomonas bacterium TaxID=1895847 RepID=UPI00157531CD|nr:response regulator [Sphingomonas bacterium]